MDIPESEADWRHATVGRVKGDQVVWGQLFKDKTLLWLTTETEEPLLGRVNFPTPSPAALAFSLAFDAARAAIAVRKQVLFSGRGNQTKSIDPTSVPALYAYFEQSMAAAVFSFQCLEAYANQVIARLATEPMGVPRRSGMEQLSPDQLERVLTTDEKLTVVLPQLMSVPSPKGRALWPQYRELKGVRDSTVQLKSIDHYVRGKVDRHSVYYRLLSRSPMVYPRIAAKLVRHFCASKPERWLEGAEARLALSKPT